MNISTLTKTELIDGDYHTINYTERTRCYRLVYANGEISCIIYSDGLTETKLILECYTEEYEIFDRINELGLTGSFEIINM